MNRKIILAILLLGVALLCGLFFWKTDVANADGVKYFSSDYKEARKKFLEASHAVGASIESFKNPETGPENV